MADGPTVVGAHHGGPSRDRRTHPRRPARTSAATRLVIVEAIGTGRRSLLPREWSDQAVLGEEVLGDDGGVFLVDVEPLVHRDEVVRRDLLADGIDSRGEITVGREVLLHHGDD